MTETPVTPMLPPELEQLLDAAGLDTDTLPEWSEIEAAILQPMFRWRLSARALGLDIDDNPDLETLRQMRALPAKVATVLGPHFATSTGAQADTRALAEQMVAAIAADHTRIKLAIERQTATITEARKLLGPVLAFHGVKPDLDNAPSKLMVEVIGLANMVKEDSEGPFGRALQALRKLGFQGEHCTSTDPIDYADRWLAERLKEDTERTRFREALITAGMIDTEPGEDPMAWAKVHAQETSEDELAFRMLGIEAWMTGRGMQRDVADTLRGLFQFSMPPEFILHYADKTEDGTESAARWTWTHSGEASPSDFATPLLALEDAWKHASTTASGRWHLWTDAPRLLELLQPTMPEGYELVAHPAVLESTNPATRALFGWDSQSDSKRGLTASTAVRSAWLRRSEKLSKLVGTLQGGGTEDADRIGELTRQLRLASDSREEMLDSIAKLTSAREHSDSACHQLRSALGLDGSADWARIINAAQRAAKRSVMLGSIDRGDDQLEAMRRRAEHAETLLATAEAKLAAIAGLDPALEIRDPLELARHMHRAMLRWESIASTMGISAAKDPPVDIAGFIDNAGGGQLAQDTMREALRGIKPGRMARTEPDLEDVLEFLWRRGNDSEVVRELIRRAESAEAERAEADDIIDQLNSIILDAAKRLDVPTDSRTGAQLLRDVLEKPAYSITAEQLLAVRDLRALRLVLGTPEVCEGEQLFDFAAAAVDLAKRREVAAYDRGLAAAPGTIINNVYGDGCKVFMPDGTELEPSRERSQAVEALRLIDKIAESLGWQGDPDKMPDVLARVRDLAALARSVATLQAGLDNPEAAEVVVEPIANLDIEKIGGRLVSDMRDLAMRRKSVEWFKDLWSRIPQQDRAGLNPGSPIVGARYSITAHRETAIEQIEQIDNALGWTPTREHLVWIVVRFGQGVYTFEQVNSWGDDKIVSTAREVLEFERAVGRLAQEKP